MRKISFEEFQKELINSLKHFNSKFNDQDVFWWANSGTMLGAVRNGKAIPWDDDADMSMFNDDFFSNKDKMQSIAEKINFEVVDPTENSGLDVARLFSKEFILVEYKGETFMTKIYIDIMLAIPSKKKSKIKSMWWEIINKYSWIYGNFYNILPKVGWVNKRKVKIGWWRNFLVFFSKVITFPFMWWVPISQNRHLKKKPNKKNTYQLFYCYNNKGVVFKKDEDLFTEVSFEGFELNVPKNYEEELLIWFGKTWKELPKEEDRIPHNLILTPYTGKEKYKIKPFLIK